MKIGPGATLQECNFCAVTLVRLKWNGRGWSCPACGVDMKGKMENEYATGPGEVAVSAVPRALPDREAPSGIRQFRLFD